MRVITALALGMFFEAGCGTGGSGSETTAGETSTGTGASTGAAETSSAESGGETTTGSSGEAPTTGPGTSATTGSGEQYCGINVDAKEPYLQLGVFGGETLADGVVWAIECGGQGSWMFGLYPSFGGWDPMSTSVSFSVTVDVAGFNNNPEGHFFSGGVGYYVGCEILDGGVTGVIPVLPGDEIADLSVLDGLPATVHVEIDGGGTPLAVDAMVTLKAPLAQVSMPCELI